MRGRHLASRTFQRHNTFFPAATGCYRVLNNSHCRNSSSLGGKKSSKEKTIGEHGRSHLRNRASNNFVTEQKKLEELLEREDLSPDAVYSLVESWSDAWKRLASASAKAKPLLPEIMVANLKKQSGDSMSSLPVLAKIIDGITAAAKVERGIPLADLAATSCLWPMATLFRVAPHREDVELFVHSVNKVMNLYCREKKVPMAESLLDMLEEMLAEIHGKTNYRYNLASSGTYAILIAGYSNSGRPREAEHVLFARMIQQRKLLPRKELFDACLTAWEIAGTKDAGHRAEFLLLRHQQWHEAHPDMIAPPNAQTLAKAVNAWVNSKHLDAPIHIGKVLDTMYAVEFTDVSIFANVHLQEMKIWSWRGNANQCKDSMNRIITHFGKMRIPPIKLQRMYATLITAHVRSRNVRQKQLRRTIDELGVEWKEGMFGDSKFWDQSLYLAMFEALAKLGDGDGAEELLESISVDDDDAPKPNLRMYNCVLLAWSKSKDSRASERAEQLFNRIIEEGTVKPDVVTFNALLAAMGRANEKTTELAYRGELYLRQMRHKGVAASVVTYNQAILLWWRVPSSDEAMKRIEMLVQEMSAAGIKPNITTFKACISVVEDSCLCTEEKQKILQSYHDKISRAAG